MIQKDSNFNYKSCDARFAIKKIEKMLKSGNEMNSRIDTYLDTICTFAEQNNFKKMLCKAETLRNIIQNQYYNENDQVWPIVYFLKDKIASIHEKRKIMEVRESLAWVAYHRKKARDEKKQKSSKEIIRSVALRELEKFDVVKAPTPGGFHYAIITDISDNYVSCIPTTTASSHKLKVLGCKSIILNKTNHNRFKGVRLTSSLTRIPYDVAQRSYCGSVAEDINITNAIYRMLAIA
jgi:hypothetical protein